MSKSKTRTFAIYLAIAVFLVDSVTKFLTTQYLPPMDAEHLWYPYGGIPVFYNFYGIDFSLVHAINRGAAWGIFSNYQGWLLIGRIVLVIGITIYATAINKNNRYDIPLALIIGGASANIVDYFFYGHVIDMFNFVFWGYDYPVFNVADSAICVGIFWLIAASSLH
jgi:signal peptidase II